MQNGIKVQSLNHVTFLEIKSGDSKLNTHQRRVRDAVNDKKVTFEVI